MVAGILQNAKVKSNFVPNITRPVPQFMSYPGPSADECCQTLKFDSPWTDRLSLLPSTQFPKISVTMKLFIPQTFCLGAAMLPLAASSLDSAVVAISDRLESGKFNASELAEVEEFIDFLTRQAQGSVVCTLSSFHLGQACRKTLLT